MNIGVTEPPFIPSRESVCDNLDTFALVSEDNVLKLVIKSKTTSCALDPMPTKLVNEYIEKLLPLLTHTNTRSIASGEFPHMILRINQLAPVGGLLLKKS